VIPSTLRVSVCFVVVAALLAAQVIAVQQFMHSGVGETGWMLGGLACISGVFGAAASMLRLLPKGPPKIQ
jgi:hypothetical protein